MTYLDIFHNPELDSLWGDSTILNYSGLHTFLAINKLKTSAESINSLIDDTNNIIKWILGLIVFLIIAKIIFKLGPYLL